MNKITLGLCMIVKNEEEVIGRCLESVKNLFDEIVIVDTGSTDKTKEIVSKFTKNVYDFKWIYDFSAARNYSFSKSNCDFIMWLDADDVIYEEDLKKLQELKKKLSKKYKGYRLIYSYIQDQNDKTLLTQTRVRIVRNDHKDMWEGKIHEVIPMNDSVKSVDITIHHKKQEVKEPKRNLDIYKKMEKNHDYFSVRDLSLYAKELKNAKEYDKSTEILQQLFKRKKEYKGNHFYYNQALITKISLYNSIKKSKKDIKEVLIKFMIDFAPSPYSCCELGNILLGEENFLSGIFWLESALHIAKTRPEDKIEYNEFCPCYGLAYAYFRIGDIDKAMDYSLKALNIFPNHQGAINNHRMYLDAFKKIRPEIVKDEDDE